MIDMKLAVQAELELAPLLGWGVTAVNETFSDAPLLGFRRGAEPQQGKMNPLPKWARDWAAAGPLIREHGLNLDVDNGVQILVTAISPIGRRVRHVVRLDGRNATDAEILYAIACAVIARLKTDSALA